MTESYHVLSSEPSDARLELSRAEIADLVAAEATLTVVALAIQQPLTTLALASQQRRQHESDLRARIAELHLLFGFSPLVGMPRTAWLVGMREDATMVSLLVGQSSRVALVRMHVFETAGPPADHQPNREWLQAIVQQGRIVGESVPASGLDEVLATETLRSSVFDLSALSEVPEGAQSRAAQETRLGNLAAIRRRWNGLESWARLYGDNSCIILARDVVAAVDSAMSLVYHSASLQAIDASRALTSQIEADRDDQRTRRERVEEVGAERARRLAQLAVALVLPTVWMTFWSTKGAPAFSGWPAWVVYWLGVAVLGAAGYRVVGSLLKNRGNQSG